jgi:hypothetical protein
MIWKTLINRRGPRGTLHVLFKARHSMPPLRRQPLVSMALHLALIVFQMLSASHCSLSSSFHCYQCLPYYSQCSLSSSLSYPFRGQAEWQYSKYIVNHSSLTKVMARVCNYFMPKAKVYQAHRSLSQVSFNFLTCRAKLQARQLLRLIC